jgi:hypothetical protein
MCDVQKRRVRVEARDTGGCWVDRGHLGLGRAGFGCARAWFARWSHGRNDNPLRWRYRQVGRHGLLNHSLLLVDLLLRQDILPLLVVGWLMVLTAVDWFEVRIA